MKPPLPFFPASEEFPWEQAVAEHSEAHGVVSYNCFFWGGRFSFLRICCCPPVCCFLFQGLCYVAGSRDHSSHFSLEFRSPSQSRSPRAASLSSEAAKWRSAMAMLVRRDLAGAGAAAGKAKAKGPLSEFRPSLTGISEDGFRGCWGGKEQHIQA